MKPLLHNSINFNRVEIHRTVRLNVKNSVLKLTILCNRIINILRCLTNTMPLISFGSFAKKYLRLLDINYYLVNTNSNNRLIIINLRVNTYSRKLTTEVKGLILRLLTQVIKINNHFRRCFSWVSI